MATYKLSLSALVLAATCALGQDAGDARSARTRQREQEFVRTRTYPGEKIPAGARTAAVAELEKMLARGKESAKLNAKAAAAPQRWTFIGPRPINANPFLGTTSGAPFAAGRVTALAIDPRDNNVLYLGAAQGGLWKTTDGGRNWTPIGDDLVTLSIGSIALAPSNPDIVYVGTGEGNFTQYYGAGILKSSDGGATWTNFPGPFAGPQDANPYAGGANIAALAVHPTNPNILLAAANTGDGVPPEGIWRSTDGGANWALVLGGGAATDVVMDPSNPSLVYAAMGRPGAPRNGVYKSTDGGITWNRLTGTGANVLPSASMARISLAISPTNPNTLFAGITNSNITSLLGLYKTTDGGQNWSRLNIPDYCTAQCFYNNVLRVNPVNPNIVVAGGVVIYRSLDGGTTWASLASSSNGYFPHSDHHALVFSNNGATLYDGNDGGVYSTTIPSSGTTYAWTDLNATLAITEFSSNVAIHPSDPNIALAGTQDNGTLAYSGNLAWDQTGGNDAGFSAIDAAFPAIRYGTSNLSASTPYMIPYKISGVTGLTNPFIDAVVNTGRYSVGIDTTDRASFYAPLQIDPSNPQQLYYGTFRLYQTIDGAGKWTAISPALAGPVDTISAIAISPALSKAVYVGSTDGQVHVSNTADQGAQAQWLDRTAGLPGRWVAQIAGDQLDSNTFYVALSGFSGFGDHAGHVFKTTDFGQTYLDVSGNLPNIPVNDLVIDPDLPNTLYAGTDLGVFQTSDGGTTWSTLSSGLPRVLVHGLNLHRTSRTLRAATAGRGMWDLSLPLSAASLGPRISSLAPAILASGSAAVTFVVTGSNFIAQSVARWNGGDRATAFVSATTLRVTLTASDMATTGRNTLAIFNPVAGGGLSNLMDLPVGPAPGFTSAGITSAANPTLSGPLVAGSLESMYGTGLAARTVAAPAGPQLPYTLGGVTVEINGIPAPLLFVSPNQLNFQTPWDVQGFSRVPVIVTNGTLAGVTLIANLAASAPALFSINGIGSGQGAILIAAPTAPVAAPAGAFPNSRPARRGEFLQIYATGLGPVRLLPGNGVVASGLFTSQSPTVVIGGAQATVTFAGLAPGAVGVYQINAQIPDTSATGAAVPVSISLSGNMSNTVTLAIQSP